MIILTARLPLVSLSHRLRLQLPAFSAEPSPSPAPSSQIQNDIASKASKIEVYLVLVSREVDCRGHDLHREASNKGGSQPDSPLQQEPAGEVSALHGVQTADLSDPKTVPEGGEGRM